MTTFSSLLPFLIAIAASITSLFAGWFVGRMVWHAKVRTQNSPLPTVLYSAYPDTSEKTIGVPLSTDPTNLKIIEGIGPRIEQLLKQNGIHDWHTLAVASQATLLKILDKEGTFYELHDPSTWPRQAQLACEGQWKDLRSYQDFLIGGV